MQAAGTCAGTGNARAAVGARAKRAANPALNLLVMTTPGNSVAAGSIRRAPSGKQ